MTIVPLINRQINWSIENSWVIDIHSSLHTGAWRILWCGQNNETQQNIYVNPEQRHNCKSEVVCDNFVIDGILWKSYYFVRYGICRCMQIMYHASKQNAFLIKNTWFPLDIAHVCLAWFLVVQGISGSRVIEAGECWNLRTHLHYRMCNFGAAHNQNFVHGTDKIVMNWHCQRRWQCTLWPIK